jgi:CRISPR-associated exonuclease Cas4
MDSQSFALIGAALLLLLVAGVALWRSHSLYQSTGLPAGEVRYADADQWQDHSQTLYDEILKLRGRPDYLIEEANGSLTPVEVKSGKAPKAPHPGHILQLAAYCMLVWENYGERPARGIIKYADKKFEVDFTLELETDLLDLLAEMREDLLMNDVPRSHDEWIRCRRCGVGDYCDENMTL